MWPFVDIPHEQGYPPFMRAIEFCAKKVFAGHMAWTQKLQISVLKGEGKRLSPYHAPYMVATDLW